MKTRLRERHTGVAISLVAAAALLGGTAGSVVAAPVVTSFSSTGALQTDQIPAPAGGLTIIADGGQGGVGGAGASVTAHLLVTSGTSLSVLVAGAGGTPSGLGASSPGRFGGGGGGGGGVGFGGGGAGYAGFQEPPSVSGAVTVPTRGFSGGGGGASFVIAGALSSSSALSTRPGDGQVPISYGPSHANDNCSTSSDGGGGPNPGATPELDSLFLFGGGLTSLGAYASCACEAAAAPYAEYLPRCSRS